MTEETGGRICSGADRSQIVLQDAAMFKVDSSDFFYNTGGLIELSHLFSSTGHRGVMSRNGYRGPQESDTVWSGATLRASVQRTIKYSSLLAIELDVDGGFCTTKLNHMEGDQKHTDARTQCDIQRVETVQVWTYLTRCEAELVGFCDVGGVLITLDNSIDWQLTGSSVLNEIEYWDLCMSRSVEEEEILSHIGPGTNTHLVIYQ
ncbi:hypothetical protein Tco_1266305 [Tanacetum coccineum]